MGVMGQRVNMTYENLKVSRWRKMDRQDELNMSAWRVGVDVFVYSVCTFVHVCKQCVRVLVCLYVKECMYVVCVWVCVCVHLWGLVWVCICTRMHAMCIRVLVCLCVCIVYVTCVCVCVCAQV